MNLFQPALDAMATTGQPYLAPQSFQKYLAAFHRGTAVNTAAAISIQDFASLPADLKAAQTMVLRLGRAGPTDATTKFALVRAQRAVRDEFFLVDADLFPAVAATFEAAAPARQILPFQLLGRLVEASALTLAIVSGALAHALGLDPDATPAVPARGAATYTFAVQPRADLPVIWTHDRGQVEIDGLLVARRAGRPCLLVIEAKWGDGKGSLAKHKLVYPCLALRARADDYDLIPVYVRTWQDDTTVYFKIAELHLDAAMTVTALTGTRTAFLRMPFQILSGLAPP